MSSILYYSKFCEHSKKLLQGLSQTSLSKDIHFICIDKRIKENDKLYIVLENGQKIVMPPVVNRVPALLLLNQNYEVLYGADIYRYLQPKNDLANRQATQNNLEPMAFSFDNAGGFGIVSDHFSSWDLDPKDLTTVGNGGMKQMHNYVQWNHQQEGWIQTPEDTNGEKGNRLPEDLTVDKLKQQRDMEMDQLRPNQPPPQFQPQNQPVFQPPAQVPQFHSSPPGSAISYNNQPQYKPLDNAPLPQTQNPQHFRQNNPPPPTNPTAYQYQPLQIPQSNPSYQSTPNFQSPPQYNPYAQQQQQQAPAYYSQQQQPQQQPYQQQPYQQQQPYPYTR